MVTSLSSWPFIKNTTVILTFNTLTSVILQSSSWWFHLCLYLPRSTPEGWLGYLHRATFWLPMFNLGKPKFIISLKLYTSFYFFRLSIMSWSLLLVSLFCSPLLPNLSLVLYCPDFTLTVENIGKHSRITFTSKICYPIPQIGLYLPVYWTLFKLQRHLYFLILAQGLVQSITQ